MLPSIIKDWALYIDNFSQLGRAKNVSISGVKYKSEDLNAGGTLGPIEAHLALEKAVLKFTLYEFSRSVLETWAVTDVSGIGVRLLAAAAPDNGQGGVQAHEYSCRGRWNNIEFSELEKGKLNELSVEMPLVYYKYIIDKDVIIEADYISGKLVTGGIDRTLEIRRAIGANV